MKLMIGMFNVMVNNFPLLLAVLHFITSVHLISPELKVKVSPVVFFFHKVWDLPIEDGFCDAEMMYTTIPEETVINPHHVSSSGEDFLNYASLDDPHQTVNFPAQTSPDAWD